MRKGRAIPGKRKTYWWTDEIANQRKEANKNRRILTRLRARRERDVHREEEAERKWKQSRETLYRNIKAAKERAWMELVETMDGDPWGRPYKILMKKIRPAQRPITETLEENLLRETINQLFPEDIAERERDRTSSIEHRNIAERETPADPITHEELDAACKGLASSKTAPGPDAVGKKIIAEAAAIIPKEMLQAMNVSLGTGVYPTAWKTARLVLLKKPGKEDGTPTSYRPVCLLNDVSKIYERILERRLTEFLEERRAISDRQYGFRRGRSTVDAIMELEATIKQAKTERGGVIAIGIDIANAFNSIPWKEIREALRRKETPEYLQRIIGSYLSDRRIEYPIAGGRIEQRSTSRGVPQGSVLGPTLWNVAFDRILEERLPTGAKVICYADDTLLITKAKSVDMARRTAELALNHLRNAIQATGLRVKMEKTVAIASGFAREKDKIPSELSCGGEIIRVQRRMPYLGLLLDSRWSFEDHLE
ncbi:UNVERIFIED_CONTAM: hypothetical protein PYX00_005045 [Menopon gallinae]|uniref:Reverse transcriptase domain-containing protein n=1 Tax=Menopon gallinae TaxID=328185 RepID=A0AAW2I6V2_9NEOP